MSAETATALRWKAGVMGGDWYSIITTPDPVWRPYAFDRVTVRTHDGVPCSLLGVVYSQYATGPGLITLAEAAAQLTGVPGHYGLGSCRPLGFRYEPRTHGLFCGECGDYITRGPFTTILADGDDPNDRHSDSRWLCLTCAEVFDLIIGHDYASGKCPCNGDARAHGYLNADGGA